MLTYAVYFLNNSFVFYVLNKRNIGRRNNIIAEDKHIQKMELGC